MASDQKAKDATEAALSAIEEALAATGTEGSAAARPALPKTESPKIDSSKADGSHGGSAASAAPKMADPDNATRIKLPRATNSADTMLDDRDPPPPPASDLQKSIQRPANDEQQTLAPLIAAMNRKPSGRPYLYALLASIAWAAAVGLFLMWRNQLEMPQALMALPTQILAVSAFVVLAPIVFFFVIAGLARRSQEMRLTSSAVAQVAMRLTEPESLASDSMVRLSQAIRREVAAMGDGIERAVARAGELEAIVHSEISNLERAYADNEIRIRGLVDELITQREAIASNADRVKSAITGAHEGLSADLQNASSRITAAMNETGARVTETFETRTGDIGATIDRASTDLFTRLSSAGDDLQTRVAGAGESYFSLLSTTGNDLAQKLAAAGDGWQSRIDGASGQYIAQLTSNGAEIAQRILTASEDVNGRLTATGQTVADTIAERAAHVAKTLDDAGERVTSASSVLTANLASTGETLTSRIENAGMGFNARLEATGNELHNKLALTSESVAETISTRAADVARALAESGDRVSGISETVIGKLHDTGETLASKLTGAGEMLTSRIENAGHEFNTRLETTGADLHGKLSSTGTSIIETLGARGEEVTRTLAETGSRLASDIVGQASQVTDTFRNTGEVLLRGLNDGGRHITQSLAETGTSVAANMAEQTQRLHEQFRAAGSALVLDMNAAGTAINTKFDETGLNIIGAITSRSDDIANRLRDNQERMHQTITVHGEAMQQSMVDTAEKMAGSLVAHSQEMEVRFTTTGQLLAAKLFDHTNALETRINDAGQFAAGLIEMKARETGELFDNRTAHLTENFVARMGDFEQAITREGGALAAKIAADAMMFTTTVNDRFSAIEAVITNHGSDLAERLESQTKNAAALFENRMIDFEARSAQAVQDVSSGIDGIFERLDGTLQRGSGLINEALLARTREMAQTMGEGGREVARALEAKAGDITQALDARTRDIVESLGAKSDMVAETISSRADAVTRALTERTADVTLALGERGAEVTKAIAERGESVTRALADSSTAMGELLNRRSEEAARLLADNADRTVERITAKAEDVAAKLEFGADIVDAKLGARALQLSDALESRIAEFEMRVDKLDGIAGNLGAHTQSFASLFDNHTENLAATLTDRGRDIVRDIASVGTTVARALDDRATGVTAAMQRTSEEVLTAFEQSSGGLRDIVEKGANETVAALTSTNERLKADIVGLLDRVNESNAMLQKIVAVASTNLSGVEHGLSERMKELEGVVTVVSGETSRVTSEVAAQVSQFRSASTGALRDAADLVVRLDEHGKSLVESTRTHASALTDAAQMLERVEEKIGATLSERHASLEHLSTLIDRRTEDVESITRAFNSMVEESLKAAEERARAIGSVLADSAQATTNELGNQFALLRNETGRERERTAAAMRSAYESVVGDMGKALTEATERFRGAASELRTMTGDIQRELETTRAELRRGVLELPKETQETTSAMRRVVSEQIKALNELSDIVTKSGRSLDVVQPVAQVPAPPAPPPAPVQTARAPEPARPVQPPRPAPVMADEPPILRPSISVRDPVRPAAPQPVQPTAKPQESRRGFGLSDILSRVNWEEPPAPVPATPPAPASANRALDLIDSVSANIVTLVDATSIADMWDRYQNNDPDAVSRRIYTVRGQQVFEELSRRYRREPEVRATLDRYVEEFERLLGDATRDDHDGRVSRAYLTSDTGKVYTILAHASGRLG